MSYILDALNKSEQERREQDNVPNLQAIHDGKGSEHTPSKSFRWMPIVVSAILVGLLFVIVMLSMSRNDDVAPLHGQPLRQSMPAQTASVRAQPIANQSSSSSFEQSSLPNVQSANAAVNSLYVQEGEARAHNLSPSLSSSTTQALARNTQASTDPIVNSVDARLAEAALADYRASEQVISRVPTVEQLPRYLQSTVPALDYSAHIYSSDERSGFAIINGRSRYKGDILSKNLFVESVEEDGVVLNIQGVSFKVPAMKSWQPPG